MRRFLPIIVLLIITLLCLHQLAFTNRIIVRGDTFVYFYPYWAARDAALRAGQIPLWTPDIFMGAPMLADIQVAALYPPNWLTIYLSPPDAIRVSILLHVTWAAYGTYLLARRATGVNRLAAILASSLYALGGHVGGHIEQINQLQGLAWMPWLFLIFHLALSQPTLSRKVRWLPLLAVALTLQILCGHTQTVFITGVGLGLYGMFSTTYPATLENDRIRYIVSLQSVFLRLFLPFSFLVLTVVLAALLILPQLVPTLELIGLSNRQGGLSQGSATAFSLSPLILGRSLLPNYDTQVFGEYVAYLGVVGLGLALVGTMMSARHQSLRWMILAGVGLFLALGFYNPLYWSLATLPGFNFFRVPARWMALFALGGAMLAGLGLQAFIDGKRLRLPVLLGILTLVVGLGAAAFLAPLAPEASSVPGLSAPTLKALLGWGAALMIFVIVLVVWSLPGLVEKWAWTRYIVSLHKKLPMAGITIIFLTAVIELFFAAGAQPYNDLSAPDAYHMQRFTVSQLEAYQDEVLVPGRTLGVSDLFFDPGDRSVLEARYANAGMSASAVRNSFDAIKMQEILAPNQSLIWGIPTIDGHGGGIIPTFYYSQFTVLLTPDGIPSFDGRLREALSLPADCRAACIPDERWLDLTGTEYIIVDKVFDFWQEGIAYDTTFELNLVANDEYTLMYAPEFVANAVDVVYTGDEPPSLLMDGRLLEPQTPHPLDPTAPSLEGFQIARFTLDGPQRVPEILIRTSSATRIRAVTLIDTRAEEVFVQLTLSNDWERVLSSDVKMYHNRVMLPRAFVVNTVYGVPTEMYASTTNALDIMRASAFDPAPEAVIAGVESMQGTSSGSSEAGITVYQQEHIEITVNTTNEGYLILTDAWYPGWMATVNGVVTPIYRADLMFRAVYVPEGESTVVFTFQTTGFPFTLIISAGAWLIIALYGVFTIRRRGLRE